MDVKKYKKADLESKRIVFLQIGFVLALGVSLLAFEWSTLVDNTYPEITEIGIVAPEDIVPITFRKEKSQPLPVKKTEPIDVIIIGDELQKVETIEEPIITEPQDQAVDWMDVPLAEESFDSGPVGWFDCSKHPSFPGGEKALIKYISKSVRYPYVCQQYSIQGTVFVSFVIDTQGKVIKVEVVKGADKAMNAEAVRVISKMSKWNPGMQRDRPVSVKYTIPIKFSLNG